MNPSKDLPYSSNDWLCTFDYTGVVWPRTAAIDYYHQVIHFASLPHHININLKICS